jgi:hypothetical protein
VAGCNDTSRWRGASPTTPKKSMPVSNYISFYFTNIHKFNFTGIDMENWYHIWRDIDSLERIHNREEIRGWSPRYERKASQRKTQDIGFNIT